MAVSLTEYTRMALDAYDYRVGLGNPDARSLADPAFDEAFPEWTHLPEGSDYGPRNSTQSFGNGLDYNVYVNEAEDNVVIGFRGTEFSAFLEQAERLNFNRITENALDRDIYTLFGYYQDGGATVEREIAARGGLGDFLEETIGLSDTEADALASLVDTLDGDPFDDTPDFLVEEGEAALRSQARQALASTLEVAADNPGKTLTVTGHSLGGALAAYVASALGVPAVAFDPAPYAADPLLNELRAFADELLAGEFSSLDTGALGWARTGGPRQTAADRVDVYRLDGSFVEDAYLSADPRTLPAGEGVFEEIALAAEGVDEFALHAMDLHALVIETEAREAEGRALAELAEALPGLLGRIAAQGEVVSPDDGEADTFYRYLTVEPSFYDLFADFVERIAAESEGFAGEGADVAGLERALIDRALAFLGEIAAAEDRFDAGQSVADAFGSPTGGPGGDVIVGEFGLAETLRPGQGADFVATGGGAADTVRGPLGALDGDTLFDFDAADRLEFVGTDFGPGALALRDGGRRLTVETGGTRAEIAFVQPLDGPLETLDTVNATLVGLDLGRARAEQVALVYEAGLGRMPDAGGLNFWIDRREAGLDLETLAGRFLGSEEFARLAGPVDDLTDAALVDVLYTNVLGRPADGSGAAFWTGRLADPGFDRPTLLAAFAESPENREGTPALMDLSEVEDGTWGFA